MTYKIAPNYKLSLEGGYIKMSLLRRVLDYIQAYKISYKYKAIDLAYYSLDISINIIY